MPGPQSLQDFIAGARITKEVFVLQPGYRALLLAIDGITPVASDDFSEQLLKDAETSAKELLAKTPVTELPHIAAWREAYKSFGTKPNKTRNSLEALTRRVSSGLPRVNRLTDIYNALSVKHQIPFGGEDLDKYTSSPFLIQATGNENFEVNSDGKVVAEHPNVGEVVWSDSTSVTCRHWNWRQTPRTALSDATTRVIFIMDALDPVSDTTLDQVADELIDALRQTSPNLQAARRIISKADTLE